VGPLDFTDVRERGPLLVLTVVRDVGWDESAVVRVDGDKPRHDVALEVDQDLAVIQLMEGTEGLGPNGAAVSFAGQPLLIPVGRGWLGRVCNGRGDPLDGGPPVLADGPPQWLGSHSIPCCTSRPRSRDHWRFGNRCVVHPGRAGGQPFSVVFAAIGLTHPDAAAVRDILEDRAAAGELALLLNTADDPVIERRSHHG
jgi:V/A-type H+/Na+-transporting ATPase subunit B